MDEPKTAPARDAEARQAGARDDRRLPTGTLDRLSQFVGYGTLKAKVWFIGPEERLDEVDEEIIIRHLQVRLDEFAPVEDCRSALLEKLKCDSYHGPKPKLQKTWAKMAAIMIGLRGGDISDRKALLQYQVFRLGARDGETLLSELLPLPKPSTRNWPDLYRREFGFKGIRNYRKHVLSPRIEMLNSKLQRCKPAVILCYSKTEWPLFKGAGSLFGDVHFEQDREDPEIETGTRDGSLVLLTPHFARGCFPKERIERVVKIIQQAHPDLPLLAETGD